MQRNCGMLKTRPFEFNDTASSGGCGKAAGEHMDNITLRMHLTTFTKKNQTVLTTR